MPRAGKLRNFVTIQQAAESQDAIGGAVQTWSTFAQRWAGFEPLAGREYFEAAGRQAEATARFWLRDELTGVVPKMRVSWDGRIFDISAAIYPEKPGGYLQLMVVEVV